MTTWEGSASSAPRTGETVDFFGITHTFRLAGKDTDGAFSITEGYVLPGAGPDFLHTHPAAETFIITEGRFEVYGRVDGKKVSQRVGPGHIHHVGSNAPHGFKYVGSTRGRVLLLFHPADLQEAFIREGGKPSTPTSDPEPMQGPPSPESMKRLGELFRKHKVELLERPGP